MEHGWKVKPEVRTVFLIIQVRAGTVLPLDRVGWAQ